MTIEQIRAEWQNFKLTHSNRSIYKLKFAAEHFDTLLEEINRSMNDQTLQTIADNLASTIDRCDMTIDEYEIKGITKGSIIDYRRAIFAASANFLHINASRIPDSEECKRLCRLTPGNVDSIPRNKDETE